MPQKDHDRIWNGRHMNDIIIMNQSESIAISARGRALGFGHALGPWSLGLGLGPGRRRPGAQRAAAWAQARAQGPGPAQRPRPRLQSFSPRPDPGQSLGIRLTCMMPGMPRTFLIRLLWILPGSGPPEAMSSTFQAVSGHFQKVQGPSGGPETFGKGI